MQLLYLFIYLAVLDLSLLRGGLSVVAVTLQLWCSSFLFHWHLLLQSMGSRHMGFSSCGAQA